MTTSPSRWSQFATTLFNVTPRAFDDERGFREGAVSNETQLILVDQIEPLIHEVRGQRVILDSDLARLYGVETKVLNRAVQRNLARFPSDFLVQLTAEEFDSLRFQFGTLKSGRGQHRKYLPYAFSEHGAFMAAGLLNSPRAVEVSVFVVRAFVKLRQLVLSHKELAGKLDQLERKFAGHDDTIRQLVAAIRQLMAPPDPPAKPMGFHAIRDAAKESAKRSPPPTTSKSRSRRNRADV